MNPNNIDTSTPAPPAVLWRTDRQRVRAGKSLVVKVQPVEWHRFANGEVCGVSDARGTYLSLDCLFPAERDAWEWTQRCAAAEYEHEQKKWEALKQRIVASYRAADARLKAIDTTTTEGATP